MKTLRRFSLLITLACCSALLLSACSGAADGNETTTAGNGSNATTIEAQAQQETQSSEFTANDIIKDKDLDSSYDENNSTSVILSDSGISVNGSGASVSDNTVKITAAGTYVLSGKLSDGRITVEAADSANVHIILKNADITCSSYSPLSIISAKNVYITLAEGTDNTLTDAASYTLLSESDNTDAVIFSKTDISFNGSGSLTVTGNKAHGICSKDDLIFTDGSYNIKSTSSGISGKDSLTISGGSFTVSSGSNALKTTNEEDADKGNINIYGGTFNLTAETDGIEAAGDMNIYGGIFNISTGGGSANSSTSTTGTWGFWGSGNSSTDTASAKGLKAEGGISISGGTINIDSSDDSVHSNSNITISAGTLTLSSGDDGIHAGSDLLINGGKIDIQKSYEGLEGLTVTINDGTIYVNSTDDGINSAGGSDTSNTSRPGMNPFTSSGNEDCKLNINGGYTVINASGDGVDSNGTLTVMGGVLLVSGPTDSANGAIDYETGATISGGFVLAAGSSGMAEGFGSSSSQCSACFTLDSSISGGTNIAVLDSSGNVIISFTPEKSFNNISISAPSLSTGSTYTVQTGGTASGADENGYASSGTYTGGKEAAQYTQSSIAYSDNSSGGFGGMGNRPR